ncbi:T9SS C-terminal target domain-containing protein [candidate division KSB1 bacterium]|nr:MAG: T9SS C-terminal target domain-containing protein [candidate division KSB1 bacterium]
MKNVTILVLFFLICAAAMAQIDLTNGLVGWYKFDDGQGDVAANSSAREIKAPDGLLTADPTTADLPEWIDAGVSGGALLFSSQSQAHVALGIYDPSEETDQLAVSCWINWDGGDGTWQPIAGLRDAWDPPTIGWSMVLDQGSYGLQFETNTTDGKVFIITEETPLLGEWMHVVLNFDGEYAEYFFDGVSVADGPMVFGEGRSTSPLRIGAGWTGGNGFNGAIDEFRFYNRLLTLEEIAFLRANPGGVVEAVESDSRPRSFSLMNYPNPFNPSTTISYTLHATESVTLQVFSMRGERVASLVNEVQNPGVHSIPFDARELAGGVYLCRLTAGDAQVETKKMVLLK